MEQVRVNGIFRNNLFNNPWVLIEVGGAFDRLLPGERFYCFFFLWFFVNFSNGRKIFLFYFNSKIFFIFLTISYIDFSNSIFFYILKHY